jgi:hypothetical protein
MRAPGHLGQRVPAGYGLPMSASHMNGEEFVGAALEANLRRALGHQADGTFRGGLVSATVIELAVGARLCRIANSSLPARMNLSSVWWVREADFVSFLRASLAEDRDLLDTIRDSLALSADFAISNDRADEIRAKYGDDALGDLKNSSGIRPWDRVFTVEVTDALLAFSGIGRDVADISPDNPLGMVRTWRAASDITQLVIPGLLDPTHRGLSELGRAALHFRRSHSLEHWREWTLPDLDR